VAKAEEQRLVTLHKLVSEEVGGEPTSNLDVVPASLAGIFYAGESNSADIGRYLELLAQMAGVLNPSYSVEELHLRLAIQLGRSLERLSPKLADYFLFGGSSGYTDREIAVAMDEATHAAGTAPSPSHATD
jgi:hypothetical protein